ncbi:MAG: helix-turn-helix transcriptional regulator [Flavobacteriales bacterium]|nr:HTH-type transcriptional activator RhaS [Flavobacteriales bacterium]MCC6576043.1 helix-turn-helix transcriptional regulator [Flavobacteriales bacterium]NUQ16242.1 helix-turn-helix transcriptional regulator [Flavobacteriales bacterium]
MAPHFHTPAERPLSDAVRSFWELERNNTGAIKESIVPKGVVEIIFNFLPGTTIHGRLYDRTYAMPKCFIQGYHTNIIELTLPDDLFLFGVVLHVGATEHILRVPSGEFARQCIDLTLVDTSFSTLWHQLAEKRTFSARVAHFSDWLTRRLPCPSPREQALNALLTLKSGIPLSVPAISEWLCCSPRHLSRILRERTGMNSEQTLLYLKYLNAVDHMHRSDLSLTRIAYACGFSDQSHFIKVFKSLTTLTPAAYRSRKSDLAGHLFEVVR